jgi:protein TonB
MEIKRLSAEFNLKAERFAKRPRRKTINASTKEYKYATYLDAWRRKVERVGNLNYPDEAKRQKLHGNLVLHVAVQADGSVKKNGIRVLHSSGHKLLDDAAIRIVRLAAPYAPFPASIRKETDILDITRTWRFLSNNRLSWK